MPSCNKQLTFYARSGPVLISILFALSMVAVGLSTSLAQGGVGVGPFAQRPGVVSKLQPTGDWAAETSSNRPTRGQP